VPKIALSDVKVRSLKPPSNGQLDYWDDKLPAFGVRVSQGGTKTFVLKRNNSRITLGRFPILSLSDARIEARRMLAEFTLGKIRPQSITYPSAVKLFITDKTRSRRKSTADQYEWFLSHFPFKGQLSDIVPSDIERTLKGIKSKSTYDHVLVAARIFFNWTIKRRYILQNPTFGLSPHGTSKRARVLSDEELIAIWNGCDDGTNELPEHYRTIVKLLILTGQRRGEIAALQRSFIEDDTCLLPGELTKNGRPHKFPVGPIAKSLLLPLMEREGAYLFPARGKADSCFNGWSKSKQQLDEITETSNWTLHDLRRTFRTNLGRLKVQPFIAERLVNHISARSDMEIIYDQHIYMGEMREAMEKWEAHLASLFTQKITSNSAAAKSLAAV
jgi:integrase